MPLAPSVGPLPAGPALETPRPMVQLGSRPAAGAAGRAGGSFRAPSPRAAAACRRRLLAVASLPRPAPQPTTQTAHPRLLPAPQVVDHYENPRNVGSFNPKDASVGTGLVGAPACGDVMKLQIKVGAGLASWLAGWLFKGRRCC